MRFWFSILLLLMPLFAAAQADLRKGWTIFSSSSFEPVSGVPQRILGGDPKTIWHSRWTGPTARGQAWRSST